VRALEKVSLGLNAGEIVGLAGESGCGKSTVVHSIIRVLPKNATIAGGAIQLNGTDLLPLDAGAVRRLRWREISVVPQSAMDALDPVMRIEDQFFMVAKNADRKLGKKKIRERAAELFERVGLNPARLREYPHQFSGGMKQRVIIALSLFFNPGVVLMDEPVTALDVIVQNQILNLVRDLQRELNMSILLVTHDISVIAKLCRQTVVMYAGKVVETGRTAQVLVSPLHPYTLGLKRSFPNIYERNRKLISIPGAPPSLLHPPPGCLFIERCPFAFDRCRSEEPELREIEPHRFAACHMGGEMTEEQQRTAFLGRATP